MSATNQNSTSTMSSDDIAAAINMATLASADASNGHSPPEPTNKESAPEVEVLGVKCSRILGIGTESRRSCPNMAVDSTRKRKTPYCKSCAEELKEIDRQRKNKNAQNKKSRKRNKRTLPQKCYSWFRKKRCRI